MEPEDVTKENWVAVLDEYLRPVQPALTAPVREHLSLEGQSALRSMRDDLPPTVRTVEEE